MDLGCGPGNSTGLLAERWPEASLVGIDNSAAMLERAREAYPDMTWIQADLANWHTQAPTGSHFRERFAPLGAGPR